MRSEFAFTKEELHAAHTEYKDDEDVQAEVESLKRLLFGDQEAFSGAEIGEVPEDMTSAKARRGSPADGVHVANLVFPLTCAVP